MRTPLTRGLTVATALASAPTGVVAVSPQADSATAVTVTSVSDTYVANDARSTSFGSRAQAWVDASPTRRILVKFAVSGLDGPFSRVTLRMHVANVTNAQSNRGGTFRLLTDTSWPESTTWDNQPVIDGPTLGALGAVSRNTWVQLDL